MVIYKTTNLINGKIYVGKDTKNKPSYIGSGKILKQAIKKHGKENFKKEILEYCNDMVELEQREIYWISKLNSISNGYNITEGGTGGDTWTNNDISTHWNTGKTPWNKGIPISDEMKSRISETKKGNSKSNSGSYKKGKENRHFGKKQKDSTVNKRVNTRRKNGSYVGIGIFKPKGVRHITDNIEFNSIKEAAEHYGITRDRVGYSCRTEWKNGKFRFI